MNTACYSILLRRPIKASQSVKSVCRLHDNTHQHTTILTAGTLVEMHWEVLPYPTYRPDTAPSDFHLFSQQKRP